MSDVDSPQASGVDQALPPRSRLLQAMLIVLSKHGYRGATITEVVSIAKVSKRTFYENFADKEACFLEIYSATVRTLDPVLRGETEFRNGWRDSIEQSVKKYMGILAANPMLTRAFVLEIATLSDEAQRVRRKAHEVGALELSNAINADRENFPEINSRPVSPLMATALMGGITELLVRAIERDETDKLGDLVDVTTDMFWSIITAPEHVPAAEFASMGDQRTGARDA